VLGWISRLVGWVEEIGPKDNSGSGQWRIGYCATNRQRQQKFEGDKVFFEPLLTARRCSEVLEVPQRSQEKSLGD